MSVIPAAKIKPKKQTILAQTEDAEGPIIQGETPTGTEWLCGSCEKLLVKDSDPGQISGVVLRCACGAYNDGSI
jgi:hypothetical protein